MKEIACNKEPSSEEGGSSLFIKCQSQALVYLGIREHNRKELFTKLRTKGYEPDLIDSVLDSLLLVLLHYHLWLQHLFLG